MVDSGIGREGRHLPLARCSNKGMIIIYDQSLTYGEAATIAEEAYVLFFPMLMGYRYAFGSFLIPSLPHTGYR